jgi:predicted TIM-barrel fold metal-dependent hydrolase
MERAGTVLSMWSPGDVGAVATVARAHPSLRVVLDHTGVAFAGAGDPGRRIAEQGPRVLALAGLPNVSVKLSGVPALSTGRAPFADVWPWIEQLAAAYGPGRLLWGSDWTRMPRDCSYADGLAWVRACGLFSPAELAQVLAGSARQVYGWP